MSAELPTSTNLPRVIIALDVETSDWDESCSFRAMDDHFHKGFPCHIDHDSDAGYICGLGYSVFQRVHDQSVTYSADEPISLVIKLPKGQTISPKAFGVHGIATAVCEKGEDLSTALQPVVALLKEGAEVSLVMCREFQKRKREAGSSLTEANVELLLHRLYKGHCTLILAKERKN